MADIVGWHHNEIRNLREHGQIVLGTGPGNMTINPVLGEGLINAHRLAGKKPRGPQLLVDCETDVVRADSRIQVLDRHEHHIAIDWIRSDTPLTGSFLDHLLHRRPTVDELRGRLTQYIMQEQDLSPEWKDGARALITTQQ